MELEKNKAEVMNLTNENKILSMKIASMDKNKNRTNEAEHRVLSQQL